MAKLKQRLNFKKIFLILIILVILLFMLRKILIKISYPIKYAEYIEKYAVEYEIEKELIYSIIKTESNFNEKAISQKNAIGLMQLLETTAEEIAEKLEIRITKEDILNPEINIKLGTKYISMLIEKYQNTELAIAAYNAGTGNVDRWIQEKTIKSDGTDIENVPYKETNNYIRKVIRDYKIYKNICS